MAVSVDNVFSFVLGLRSNRFVMLCYSSVLANTSCVRHHSLKKQKSVKTPSLCQDLKTPSGVSHVLLSWPLLNQAGNVQISLKHSKPPQATSNHPQSLSTPSKLTMTTNASTPAASGRNALQYSTPNHPNSTHPPHRTASKST